MPKEEAGRRIAVCVGRSMVTGSASMAAADGGTGEGERPSPRVSGNPSGFGDLAGSGAGGGSPPET
jgi:hypothetical protein